ncbi:MULTISPECIES: hypothetical protein [Rhizobiaceae]|uniref:hypothetical protein n=1 Tax=Rhizobiaceae TaxID=82115 RepID=UPI000FDB3FCD|nr:MULTISPECIES: hypothetical protein [Rhizobiaceae]MBY3499339.1 hypothetical protein [Rhizobium laguerreae]RVJ12705.1 hypothetical protein CN181_03620 [Sinorhizobium medicae]
MNKKPVQARGRLKKPLTGAEVGRFLKSLALLQRDPRMGNIELSEALMSLGKALLETKSSPLEWVIDDIVRGEPHLFREGKSFASLSLQDVKGYVDRSTTPKGELISIGVERFGIAKSRLDRLPREEVIAALRAALEHEESLNIISEEAKRGGQLRSS